MLKQRKILWSLLRREFLTLESLAKSILKHPVEQLDNQDALMHMLEKI